MHKRLLSALAALAATLPLMSHAETMDYSYGEIAYLDTEIDGGPFDVDGDGFGLRGSIAIQNTFFAFAEYQSLDFDFVDASLLAVGGGAHWPLTDKLDIVGRLGLVKAEIEVDNFFGPDADADEDGLMLGARLRAALMPQLEVEGGFDYRDIDQFGNDTVVLLEGRYFFIDTLAGGLMLELGDDSTTIGLNVRLTF